jgi:hypothetical protein
MEKAERRIVEDFPIHVRRDPSQEMTHDQLRQATLTRKTIARFPITPTVRAFL